MPSRNVTLTLSDETLKLARHLAVENGTSLSRFLEELVLERARSTGAWAEAKSGWITLMSEGIDLGIGRNPSWSRDELHER